MRVTNTTQRVLTTIASKMLNLFGMQNFDNNQDTLIEGSFMSNTAKKTFGLQSFKVLLAFLFLVLGISNNAFGQASLYTFLSATGASSETITSPTVVTTPTNGTVDDGNIVVSPAGFTFTFNSVAYTTFTIGTNGYMIFGTSSSTSIPSSLNGLSINSVYAFGADHNLNTANSGNLTHGAAAGGKYVFQYTKLTGNSGGSASSTVYATIQMVLWGSTSATPGKIEIIYGTSAGTPSASYIGIADASNTFVSANNAGSTTTASSTATWPVSGTKYTFTPPPPCVAPTGLAASATATATGVTNVGGSFTATSGTAPTGYIVVRSTSASAPATPAPATALPTVAGTFNAVAGTFVEYVNTTAGSWTSTALTPSTNYYYYVFSYNNTACSGGPIYSASTTPTGIVTTQSCASYSGTMTVGPTGTFASLTSALATLASCSYTGNIVLELQSTYVSSVETFPITFGATLGSSISKKITIRPAAGATNLSITSSNTTGTITINGAPYITFDGRPGGVGSLASSNLTIENTNVGASYALQFINDAVNGAITFCNVKSANTATTSGTIFISTTTATTGNDNIIIDSNNIFDATAGTPTNAIYAAGTSTKENDAVTISNNNIYNFFNASGVGTGINIGANNALVSSVAGNAWTITGNSLYQTATRVGASSTYSGILVNGSTGTAYTITNNFIGGGAASCGGSAWTNTGTNSSRFVGINLTAVGSTGLATTSVQGNTIANMVWGSTSGATTLPGVWAGIYLASGNANIGTVTGNTIGSGTGTGSILLTSSSTGGFSVGIGTVSISTVAISNNTIGSITIAGSSTSISHGFVGIWNTASATSLTISGNTIGSTSTLNSINNITSSTSSTVQQSVGILNSGSTVTTLNVTNNTIANLNNNYAYTSSATIASAGIYSSGSGASTTSNFTGNTIFNLSTTSPSTGTGSSQSLYGIYISNSATSHTISTNKIYGLNNNYNGTNATSVTGIYLSGSTTNVVSRNLIHSLNNASTSITAQINGFLPNAGTTTISNNQIALGYTSTGASITNPVAISGVNESVGNQSYYYNSISVGGTGVTTGATNTYAMNSTVTTNTRNYRNNIFVNTRSNSTSTGKHYAVRMGGSSANPTGLTINFNDYFVSGTGGTFGFFNLLDVASLAAWKTAVGQDANSINSSAPFNNSDNTGSGTNLQLTANTGFTIGVAGTGITTDYNGSITRNTGGAATIGAFETAGDSSPPSITYTAIANTCSTADVTLTATITDFTGVGTGANLPRIYFRKNNGTWFNSPGTNTSGSTYTFTISSATLGGVAGNDVIKYYVVAQDTAGTPNVGASPSLGFVGTSVSSVTTAPTSPNSYNISNSLNGTYTVGVGGNYTTLTAAVAAYNSGCLAGPVVFTLTDATYPSETFPIIITSNSFSSATNTLTIKPNTGVTTTITGSNANGILLLNGADYVTIDGSNSGGATKNLTISNSNTGTTSTVVYMLNASATDTATNNTIKNTILTGNASTTTLAAAYIGNTSTTAGNNNNTIQNNTISKAQTGIEILGNSATSLDSNLTITGNTLGSVTVGDGFLYNGIYTQYQTNATISNNDIQNVTGSGSSFNIGVIQVVDIKNSTITRNKIYNSGYTGVSTLKMYGIWQSAATFTTSASTSANTYSNNVIYGLTSSGASSLWNLSGINLDGGYGDKFYYNSVSITGAVSTASGPSAAFSIGTGGTSANVGCGGFDIRNNIFSMTGSSTSTPKLYAHYTTLTSYTGSTVTNNDLYVAATGTATSGLVRFNATDYNTLALWQGAVSGIDASSVSIDPVYTSTTNLVLQATSTLLAAGTTIAGVTTDFNGITRPSSPTLGAYQAGTLSASALSSNISTCFSTLSVTPSSFTVTGSNLSGAVTVSATGNFTVSSSSGGTYGATATLTPSSGVLSAVPVYVKYNAPATPGSVIANVTVSGGGAPSVTTSATGVALNTAPDSATSGTASAITSNSATVSGTFANSNGCSSVTVYGIEYNQTQGFANGAGTGTTQVASTNQSGGSFTSSLTGLSSNTIYYFHAYATNSGGTVYGAEGSFTTLLGPKINAASLNSQFGNGCVNSSVITKNFTLVGSNLTNDITVSGAIGFTFSSNGTTYSNPLVVSQSSGAVNTTVYVQFAPTVIQSYTGSIVLSSTNATSVNVAVTSAAGVASLASLSYATPSATYCQNAAIATNVATTTANAGTLSFSSNPALPNGLSFSLNGSLTGTPTVTSTAANYTITADNGCSTTTAVVNITVTGGAPTSLSFSSNTAIYCLNTAITANTPSNSGGVATSYSVSPALPTGLTLNTSSGVISGTPTVAAAAANYTVTATNNCGFTTKAVNITVNALPTITSATATPTPVCSGATINLAASSIVSSSATATVGAGASSSTTYHNPFYGLYSNIHTQHVILASELTNAGLTAGNITSVGMTFTTANSAALLGLSVKISSTTATNASTYISTSGSSVYTSSSFQSVLGLNTFAFTTPFNWDGSSNIVLEFCYGDASTTATNVSTVNLDTTGYVSSNYYRSTSAISATTACSSNTLTGSYSARPQFKFVGQVGTNNTSLYTWSWNSSPVVNTATGTTSVTVSSNLGTPVIQNYSVTATDAAGCKNTATTANVTINSVPAPTSAAYTYAQCGTQTPTFTVSGTGNVGSTFKWYTYNGSIYTQISAQVGSSLSSYPISTTTDLYIAELSSGGCESAKTKVTVNVSTPDTVAATLASSAICLGQSVTLTAAKTSSANNNSYTYTWASPAGGAASTSFAGGSGASSATSITPTAAGSYTYTVTAVDGLCATTATTATLTVNANPTISSVTATPTPVCSGATINLAAASIVSGAGTKTLGLGATASSNPGNSIFYGLYGGAKTQYIIKASELTLAGLTVGNITSLAFETSGATLGTYEGFALNIGSTSATAASFPLISSGLSQVYSGTGTNGAYTAVSGVNTLTFTTPFYWDGSSNIVLSFCWAKNPTASSATYTILKSDDVGFTSAAYGLKDSTLASTMCPYTLTTDFGSTSTTTTRPKFTFAGQVGTNNTSLYTWSWNSSPAVTAATGTTTVTNNTSAATTQTFTATASLNGCSTQATTSAVTINASIPAPTANSTTFCGGANATCSVTGTGRVGNTFKWYTFDGVATYTLIASQTGSSLLNYPITTTTTFYVSETDGLCESAKVAVTNTVTTAPAFALSATTTSNCVGSASAAVTIATNGSNNYTNFSWTNSSTVAGDSINGWTFNPTVNTTYTLTATGGGCSALATVAVTANPLPAVSITGITSVCAGGSTTLTAVFGSFSTGSAAVGTQSTTDYSSGLYRSGNGVGDYRHQLLYTAAELKQAGLGAGNLTSIGFNVTSSGSGSYNNYTISMATTNATVLTSTFQTGTFQQVFSAATYTPATSGLNTHTFSTPFYWDGNSNIVVNFCYNVSVSSGSTTLAVNTPTAVSNVQLLATTNACSVATGTTFALRPITTFGGQLFTSSGTGTFLWSDASTASTLTVSPSVTTTYSVKGTSTTTCQNTATATVTVLGTATAPTATNGSRCGAGVVTTATVANTNGYTNPTFKWYADNVTTTALQTSTSTSYTTSISATTTFYVSVVNPVCGVESTRTAVIATVNNPATVTILPVSPTICAGGSVQLTASGATSYTWTGTNLTSTTVSNPTATPSATSTYSVIGIDSNNCTTASVPVVVTVNQYPTAVTASASKAAVCSGGAVNLSSSATAPNVGLVNFSEGFETFPPSGWSFINVGPSANSWATSTTANTGSKAMSYSYDAVTTTNAANTWAITPSQTLTAGVTYTVTYWEKVISSSFPENLKLTVGTAATVAAQTTTLLTQAGLTNTTYAQATTTFTPLTTGTYYFALNCYSAADEDVLYVDDFAITGGTTPTLTYAWTSTPSGFTSTAQNPTGVAPSATGTYTVTAYNGSCGTPATTSTVTVNPLPTFTLNGTTICPGGSATLTPTATVGTGPFTYSWTSSPSGFTSSANSITVSPSVATIYSLNGTDANGCATSSPANATVTINTPATITITSAPVTICAGQSTILTVSGATSYIWTPTPASIASNGASVTVSPSVTTTYSVTGVDANGCTTAAKTVVVTVLNQLTAITASAPNYCIGASSLALSSTSATGTNTGTITYSWTGPNGFTANTQNATVTAPSGGGTYTVTATNGYCSKQSSVTVTQNPLPTITATDAIICKGSSATLTAMGASTYSWSPSTTLSAATGTSVSATPTATQVYTITGTNSNGCINTGTVTVTVTNPGAIVLSGTTTTETVSPNQQPAVFHVNTQAGPTYTYQWQVSTPGGISWTNVSDDYVAASGSNAATGNYTGSSTNTLTVANITDTSFDGYKYQCIVTGNSPCASLTPVEATLTVSATGIALQPTDVTVCSSGTSAVFTSKTNGDEPYGTGWQMSTDTGTTFNDITDGTDPITGLTFATTETVDPVTFSHTLTLTVTGFTTANNGVKFQTLINFYLSSNAATLTVNPELSISANPTNQTVCSGSGASFSVTASYAAAYQWQQSTDGGSSWANVGTNLPALTLSNVPYTSNGYVYKCLVSAKTSCTSASSTSAILTVNPTPTATIVSNGGTICTGANATFTVNGTNGATLSYTITGQTGTQTLALTGADQIITATTPSAGSVVLTLTSVATALCSSTTFATATSTVTINPTPVATIVSNGGTICTGANATFAVNGTNGATLSYTITGQSGTQTLALTGVNQTITATNPVAGSVDLTLTTVATAFCSSTTFANPSSKVTVNPTPVATIVSNGGTICAGGNATFTVNGTSGATLSYTITGQSGTQTLALTGVNQTITATNPAAGSVVLTLTTVATALCSSTTFTIATATVIINSPAAINSAGQPVNQSVCVTGGTATFTGIATGDNLSYQWEVSTNSGANWSNYVGTGATTASISIVNPTIATNNNQYRLKVTGTVCSSTVTSSPATLFINNPTITGQPVAATVITGDTAIFSVVTSVPGTTYQWQRSATLNGTYLNVANATPTGVTYANDTTATLSVITSATTVAGTANFYRCVVTNTGCTTLTSTGGQMTVIGYCTASLHSSNGDLVTKVTITGTTLNSSNGVGTNGYQLIPPTPSSNTASMIQGVSYPITLALTGSPSQVAVWVDFDKSGTYTSSEYFLMSISGATATGTIVVPLGATLGNTGLRMRARAATFSSTDACTSFGSGETEDYVITITAPPACTSGVLVAGTAATATSSVCSGSSASVTLTGGTSGFAGVTYQWQFSTNNGTSWTNAAGSSATTTTLTTAALSVATSFKCVSTCSAGGSVDSNIVDITVNNPTLSSPVNGTRCGTGTVPLSISTNAGSTVNWFAASSGGTSLGTGTSFTTPSIAATTTYYAEASIGGSTATLGPISPSIGTYGTSFTGSYEIFTVTSPVKLVSVDAFATAAGTVTVELLNSAGTVLQTSSAYTITAGQANTTLTVVGSPITIPVGFDIPAGTGYRLNFKSGSTATLVRNDSGGIATYGPALGVTITGNSNASSSYYYNFYNWSVSTGCFSARTAVTATVTAPPALALSSSAATICSGDTTAVVNITPATVGNFTNYSWLPSTGVSGTSATGYTFNPIVTTTYTLTATTAAGCTNTANFTVTVNPLPTGVTATALPTSLCADNPINLTSSYDASSFPSGMSAYTASRTTNTGYTSIFPGTTITTWRNTTSTDDNLSDNQPIGFSFNYNGTPYTNFRVSTNGFITFNTTSTAIGNGSNPYSYTNDWTTAGSGLIVAGNWDDLQTAANAGTVADLNNSINYTTTGATGSRILTVEWKNMQDYATTSTASYNWQVKLYEFDNHIEFVYGTMTQSAASLSYSLGLSAATVSATPLASELLSQTTANTGTFGFTNQNSLATIPSSNTKISFVTGGSPVYSWTGPNSFSSSVANPSIVSATTAATGVYNLVVSNSITGCKSAQAATASVTVNAIPTATIVSNGGAICTGAAATFTINGTNGATLSYTITGQTGTQTLALTGVNQTITATTPAAGSVVLTLTNVAVTATTCSSTTFATATSTVIVNPTPVATIVRNGGTICSGSAATFTVNGTNGATLSYTITGQTGTQTLALTGVDQTITALNATAGSVVLTLNNVAVTATTCSSSTFATATSTVTVNARPTGGISGTTTYCAGQATTTNLSISVTGSGTVSGTLVPGNIAFSGTAPTITVTVSPLSTTTYTIATLSDANCTSIAGDLTGSATVRINTRPTGTISGAATYCAGQTTTTSLSIAVTGLGPWSGTLSNGASFSGSSSPISVSVTPSVTTTYTIATLSDANCTSIAGDITGSATVTVKTRPTGTISGTGTYCAGQATTTSLSIVVTGLGPWSGTLSNGTSFSGSSSPISVSVAPSGTTTYTIATLSDANCASIAGDLTGSATVTVNPTNTISLSSALGTDSQSICLGSAITTITYATSGATGATFVNLPAGVTGSLSGNVITILGTPTAVSTNSYKVILTGGCGSAIAMGSIIVNAPTSHTTTVTACGTYTWAAPLGDGNTYTTSQTGLTHYSTNASGCTHTETLNLTITACSSVVNLKMFIQGYYTGSGTMTSVKNNQDGVSPTDEVENLTVELHDATTYALVATTTATLKTNGTMVCTFATAPSGSFYIAVKGSNLVQTWSATPQTVGATPLAFDFSTTESQSYTDGSQPSVVELETGVWGMYSGDVNQDEIIDAFDTSAISNDSDAAAFGVLATDLNGDGIVDAFDASLGSNNSDASLYSQHP